MLWHWISIFVLRPRAGNSKESPWFSARVLDGHHCTEHKNHITCQGGHGRPWELHCWTVGARIDHKGSKCMQSTLDTRGMWSWHLTMIQHNQTKNKNRENVVFNQVHQTLGRLGPYFTRIILTIAMGK